MQEQSDQILQLTKKEHAQMTEEVKGFKERCQILEQEMEIIKGKNQDE